MLEIDLENRMKRWVLARGGLYLKLESPGTDGIPDRLIILKGKVVFHELKTDSGTLEVSQRRLLPKMEKALVRETGFEGPLPAEVRVTYGLSGLCELMNDLAEEGVA